MLGTELEEKISGRLSDVSAAFIAKFMRAKRESVREHTRARNRV